MLNFLLLILLGLSNQQQLPNANSIQNNAKQADNHNQQQPEYAQYAVDVDSVQSEQENIKDQKDDNKYENRILAAVAKKRLKEAHQLIETAIASAKLKGKLSLKLLAHREAIKVVASEPKLDLNPAVYDLILRLCIYYNYARSASASDPDIAVPYFAVAWYGFNHNLGKNNIYTKSTFKRLGTDYRRLLKMARQAYEEKDGGVMIAAYEAALVLIKKNGLDIEESIKKEYEHNSQVINTLQKQRDSSRTHKEL